MLTTLNRIACNLELAGLRLSRRLLPNATKKIVIGSTELELPLPHELPVYRKYCPFYDTLLTRLAKATLAAHPQARAIDVGANVGDTLAFLRAEADLPVLCIEGEPGFLTLLRWNALRFPGAVVEATFLGECEGTISIQATTVGGTCELQTSRHPHTRCTLQTLDNVLAKYPDFSGSKLLKIDTDGFDGAVLRGARQFLERAAPVLIFEYTPDLLARNGEDGLSLFQFLRDHGYSYALAYSNHGELNAGITLSDQRSLEILRTYLQGKGIYEYVDLCVFPKQEEALLESFVASEIAYFRNHPSKRS